MVHTDHQCAVIHETMSKVAQGISKSSDHYEIKMGKIRKARDFDDLSTIQNWFTQHNPFNENITRFKSISTGICSDKSVNCDETEIVGKRIQQELDGMHFPM